MPKIQSKKEPKTTNPAPLKDGESTAGKQPNNSRKKPKGQPIARPVIYPERECFIFDELTDEEAKQYLGWQEESENIKFGKDFLIRDEHGHKIRMNNNLDNRPIYASIVSTLKAEILRGNWEFNFENVIIGKTGKVLNGQHSLIALVLACQCWDKDLSWRDYWPKRPTIAKSVGVGVEETDKVINTMDTCKPRDLRDVVFRSEHLRDKSRSERMEASRAISHAINMLWARTGAGLEAFAPRRTHTESMHFLNRHLRLLEAVSHIIEENCDGTIGTIISPGYASALLYLMAAAKTENETKDKTGYSQVVDPSEELIDFTLWDRACEFWVFIGQGTEALLPVKQSIQSLMSESGGVTIAERMAICIKAWNLWSNRKKVDSKSLDLKYEQDEDGVLKLVEYPIVGGIDLGKG